MFYVYVLKSRKNGSVYIGYTSNLRRRFEEHNNLENARLREKQVKNWNQEKKRKLIRGEWTGDW